MIRSLKVQIGENPDYQSVIEQSNLDRADFEYRMEIIPVGFSISGKALLQKFQHVVSKGWFSINPIEHKDLVVEMRMARFNDTNGNLDKEKGGSTFDLLDATRLALSNFEINQKQEITR